MGTNLDKNQIQSGLFFLIILFSIVMSGCSSILTGNLVYEPVYDFGKNITVGFSKTENLSYSLEQFILSANSSIHAAFYELNLKNIISLLSDKYDDGLDVKLVVDNQYCDEVDYLDFVRCDDSRQYSHNKFVVIDEKSVWTGSMNPTFNGVNKNDNNVVFLDSVHLAKNYEDEFDELWSGEFGGGLTVKYPVVYYNGKRIENYFCPEDECAKHIVEVLSSASDSIYFMTFSFTHDDIGKTIRDFSGKKLGVFENFQKNGKGSEYQYLINFSVVDTNRAMMHHKVFIVDEKIVITGSMNPTASGNNKNDENILIIYDENVAKQFVAEFERLIKNKK